MPIIYLHLFSCGDTSPPLPPRSHIELPDGRLIKYSSVHLFLLKATETPEHIFLINGSPTDQALQICAKENWIPTAHVGISENSATAINDYLNGIDKDVGTLSMEHLKCRQ